MEALSPRDTNAHVRVKQDLKQKQAKPKTASTKLSPKEKDHPPPPPQEVHEPISSDRKDGAVYKTGQLLGRGGFAICYEGQLVGTRQKFALKIVKTHMPLKKMEQKFQTELQIHSKMKHANIVQFHRAFSFEKCTYIVLELCPNGSLMDIVKKRRYITESEVRFWTVQMAGAIKYMHGKGIIHRDLKMGNIFLDKDMNIKIGDFGLAALLMSGKDWQACRRTTLCGTPNYIAPEILSKDKGGHDHAVDIWSLGIIIFAMLTGKPPFQSATADEIYRRAREREYDWPKLDTSENFISEETKDLVSNLLQAAEKRPDPDTIVQHPFFTCGWTPVPEQMTPALRERHPEPNQFFAVGIRGGKSNSNIRNLKKLCMECEVGPWTPVKYHISTYREVEEEEKLGLTPIVPLAEDVVYRPIHEWFEEETKQSGENPANIANVLEKINPMASKAKHTKQPAARASAPSFAAQQRARTQPSTVESRQFSQDNKSRPLLGLTSRMGKSQKSKLHVKEEVTDVEDRLADDMARQLNAAEVERKLKGLEAPIISLNASASIFSRKENIEPVPGTKPDHILLRLRNLQTELERALNSRSMQVDVKIPKKTPAIVVKWVDYTNKFGLGYILSNGSVGSIFKAIPAFFQDPSKGNNPPTCILVRDSERHILNQGKRDWAHFGQIVPLSGPNIEFFEDRGDSGLVCGRVNPQNFKTVPGPNGEMFKLGVGRDEYDSRKKERVALWRKFANYMTQYGRDGDYPYDEAYNRASDTECVASNVVTFYQRWGDVGCWGFGDGHFQFNFPDHTKVILSADGTWCDFYHLPLEAARDLAERGILAPSALDDRQHLSYPLQTMLNFMAKPSRSKVRKRPEIDPMIQGIPQANDLRRKIEFITHCVSEWTRNGGLGISDMSVEGRLRWIGARQAVGIKLPLKHVWVCVGGQASDERKVMWFDPKQPDLILPDMEH